MIVLVANIYLIANLAHPEDTKIGKLWISRIVVYSGFVVCFLSVLIVFQDVDANKHNKLLSLDEIKEFEVAHQASQDVTIAKVDTKFAGVWLF